MALLQKIKSISDYSKMKGDRIGQVSPTGLRESTHFLSDRSRQKYARTRQHPLSKRQIKMFEERAQKNLSPQQLQKKLLREKMLKEIQREKNPEKLKEKMDQARKDGLLAMVQKDMERLKKMEKAQERLKEAVHRLLSTEVSASVKEGTSQIKSGHVSSGLHEFTEAGREGAVGNEISSASSEFSENAKILSNLTGKHVDSVLQKTLKEHSRPADSINKEKEKDGRDENKEGRISQKTTLQYMAERRNQSR